ncbi:MAG TPA: class I SAM-dependent methyltransferase [Bryobacteraceae bacterium]|nr:class I SAM-dependent methyltransferase [Bryobacteraceae bacterium]
MIAYKSVAAVAERSRSIRRPSARISDLWKAPLHDFPIRDHILYQYLPMSTDLALLEVGPGSGFTAFRLAREVDRVCLVDVAAEPIDELRGQFSEQSNVECVYWANPAGAIPLREEEQFDAAFALDVFEYVPDACAWLQEVGAVLKPGGDLFLTYPNAAPPQGDGVTYFSRVSEIAELLRAAGYSRHTIQVVRVRPFAALVYRLLHELPLHLYRRLRKGDRNARPQTYEGTWAFQQRLRMRRQKVLVHLYWAALGLLLRLGGNVFKERAASGGILGEQLVLRAWKDRTDGLSACETGTRPGTVSS